MVAQQMVNKYEVGTDQSRGIAALRENHAITVISCKIYPLVN